MYSPSSNSSLSTVSSTAIPLSTLLLAHLKLWRCRHSTPRVNHLYCFWKITCLLPLIWAVKFFCFKAEALQSSIIKSVFIGWGTVWGITIFWVELAEKLDLINSKKEVVESRVNLQLDLKFSKLIWSSCFLSPFFIVSGPQIHFIQFAEIKEAAY
jgi:hypothetical protein